MLLLFILICFPWWCARATLLPALQCQRFIMRLQMTCVYQINFARVRTIILIQFQTRSNSLSVHCTKSFLRNYSLSSDVMRFNLCSTCSTRKRFNSDDRLRRKTFCELELFLRCGESLRDNLSDFATLYVMHYAHFASALTCFTRFFYAFWCL